MILGRKGIPFYCAYCRRYLEPRHSKSQLAYTRDHVMPQSLGGTRTVPCCKACNALKGDLHPDLWRRFMAAYPTYWRDFTRHIDVRRAVWRM